jgi:hypothetical protein
MNVEWSGILERYSRGRYRVLPQLDQGKACWLWVWNTTDGPIDGVAEFEGARYWFTTIDFSPEPHDGMAFRHYLLIDLTAEQRRELERSHEHFHRRVGKYRHFDPDRWAEGIEARRRTEPLQRQGWAEYCAMAKEWPAVDLSANRVIGWLEVEHQSLEDEHGEEQCHRIAAGRRRNGRVLAHRVAGR